MEINEEIAEINKELGGHLSRPGSLDFACDRFRHEKSIYKGVAYLIRAIVVDHCFSDFSKSTATVIAFREFKKEGIACREEPFFRGLGRIAKNNITDINKIERGLRKWCKKL